MTPATRAGGNGSRSALVKALRRTLFAVVSERYPATLPRRIVVLARIAGSTSHSLVRSLRELRGEQERGLERELAEVRLLVREPGLRRRPHRLVHHLLREVLRERVQVFQQRHPHRLVRARGEQLDDGGRDARRERLRVEPLRRVQHRMDRERGRAAEHERLGDLRKNFSLHARLGERLQHAREVPEELFLLDRVLEREVIQKRRRLHELVREQRGVIDEFLRVIPPRRLRPEELLVILEQRRRDATRLSQLIRALQRLAPVHLLYQAPQPPRVDRPRRALRHARPVPPAVLLRLVLIRHREARVHDARVAVRPTSDGRELAHEVEPGELPIEPVGHDDRRRAHAAVHERAVVGEERHRGRDLTQPEREVIVSHLMRVVPYEAMISGWS
eukprot:31251-Pelagococcus_subviridis.AAC.5